VTGFPYPGVWLTIRGGMDVDPWVSGQLYVREWVASPIGIDNYSRGAFITTHKREDFQSWCNGFLVPRRR